MIEENYKDEVNKWIENYSKMTSYDDYRVRDCWSFTRKVEISSD